MGNKKDIVWVCEVFSTFEKEVLLKVYEFPTMSEVSYVLGMPASVISNYYHRLIRPRGVLRYINIYQKQLVF